MSAIPKHYFSIVDTTERMADLFAMTFQYGLLDRTFYGMVTQVAEFISLMREAALYAVIQEDVVVGYTWMNAFSGKSALTHICLFPTARNRVHMGKDYLDFILNSQNEDGEYFIDSLVGYAPSAYTHASQYALNIGFDFIGVIPSGVDVGGEVMDVNLFTITRGG